MKGLRIILFVFLAFTGIRISFAERITVEVGEFEKLKINGNIAVICENLPDSIGYAWYEDFNGDSDIFTFSTKKDGTLKVEPSDEKWGQTGLPVVHLYSASLSSVESFSDQSVEVIGLAPCSSFSVNQVGNGSISVENIKSNNVTAAITTGNGTIYLTGSCLNANYRMVGAGLISADQLRAENIKCRILGTGSIGCWPIDNLRVTGLGSTKIYYKGSPNIKKTGGGKLFELPDDMEEDEYARLGTPVKSLEQPAPELEEEEEEEEDYETVVTEDE